MRGHIQGLESPHPIGYQLPAVFAEDDFAQGLVSGLDEVLAPVFNVLDCVEAYFDPQLAPADFLVWLATWVGVEVRSDEDLDRQRDLIQEVVGLYGVRGTPIALRRLLEIFTQGAVDISDSGGASWSPVPGGELPGSAEPSVTVRVRSPAVDEATVRQLVATGTPAHVVHHVEVERQ
jgi:phage tail-like protein